MATLPPDHVGTSAINLAAGSFMSGVDPNDSTGRQRWLCAALGLPVGDTPFPWQEALFGRFMGGTVDRSIDIPTGLGKTAVMAVWLVARAHGAPLPRRLIYVVDRRAVVDQATQLAIKLRDFVERTPALKDKLGLEGRSLPISTLRGQYVDNKDWLEDPSSPAIVVGTVDMIGSRLLFEGYGTSRKMRPYHAGLIGADTLVVLDEAHLVPPFERLLEAITDGEAMFGSRDPELRAIIPPFRLLSLSATGRPHSGSAFGLQPADLHHDTVKRRLEAPKRLTVQQLDATTKLEDALAEQAWELAAKGALAVRCIVFCDRREVAANAEAALRTLAEGVRKSGRVEVDTELFVGGRRVFEREDAARRLRELGFIAGTNAEPTRPAFVFATSAGEVGVDLDADHMVSDLVAWERMVQRLGRVNRRGDGDAKVVVVAEPEPENIEEILRKAPAKRTEKETAAAESVERRRKVRMLLDRLPRMDDAANASSGALQALKQRAEADPELWAILDAATTPAPLRPALSRALVDAWSMTSLKEHTGRPEIDPWLRGWIKGDPRTAVIWRTHLPVRTDGSAATVAEIEAFFEAVPPHASEMLETEAFRVIDWLLARAKAAVAMPSDASTMESGQGDTAGAPLRTSDVVAFVLSTAGDLRKTLTLEDLNRTGGDKKARDQLQRDLAQKTLIVDARLAGLTAGLLDKDEKTVPRTVDDGQPWMEDGAVGSPNDAPVVRFRVRSVEADQAISVDAQWRERFRFHTEVQDGETIRWLLVEKWRHDAATEDDRSASRPQHLEEHQAWAEARARDLGCRLGLPAQYVEALACAARLHDEGKRVRIWQRAFNAPDDQHAYAKTNGPINYALLDGYRHELGSLFHAQTDERLRGLPGDLRELVLHLITAHHGFARPVIATTGCQDAPPSALEERAREIALRFARLQKRWGPWGLAWWESIVRAADQQVSRDNDADDKDADKGNV